MTTPDQVTLTLSDVLRDFVREETARGAFASQGDFVRELIRDRYRETQHGAARQEHLDAALARGLADADAGRVLPLDEAFRRLRAELGLGESSPGA